MRGARPEYDEPSARTVDATGIGLRHPARYGQNDCEIALGRKSWLFAGSDRGGERVIGRRDRAEITWLTPLATSWVICAADLSLSLDHLVGAGASTSRSVSISNSPSCNSDYSVSGWRPKAPARRKATAELIRREQALWRTFARELHRPNNT